MMDRQPSRSRDCSCWNLVSGPSAETLSAGPSAGTYQMCPSGPLSGPTSSGLSAYQIWLRALCGSPLSPCLAHQVSCGSPEVSWRSQSLALPLDFFK
jgi:hypothetical protein